MNIKIIESQDSRQAWDDYVYNHPRGTVYHLTGWQRVIEKTYGHKSYYLMAIKSDSHPINREPKKKAKDSSAISYQLSAKDIVGILPLIHLKHFLFGNSLISMPFFDLGGVLADDEDVEKALLSEAIKLAQQLKVARIELRHMEPLSCLNSNSSTQLAISYQPSAIKLVTQTLSNKVRMGLDLPESSEKLMKSFKSKLRSQIKKPLKEGLNSRIGNIELLNDFYKVFSVNMRDLGSPVHSKKLMQYVLEEFPDNTKIVLIYKDDQPLACSMTIAFKQVLENPWASALREYSKLSPNMLLYWTMLEYGSENGFTCFDFGRSSPNEGTYKFKEQWGAEPTPLNWHFISLNGQLLESEGSDKSKFETAIQYWKKLPVPITRILGPPIRKHIGL